MWTNTIQDLLEPLFQPIADRNGKVYAYEALMRFAGEGHRVSPLAIVKRWERTGFIRVLDRAMLVSIAYATRAAAMRPRLAVNVSITTVERDGAAYLADLQELAGRTRSLIVELTETAPVRDASPWPYPRFLVAAHHHCAFAPLKGGLLAASDLLVLPSASIRFRP